MAVSEFDFSTTAFTAESDWGRCVQDFLAWEYSKSGSVHTLKTYRSTLGV